MGEPVVVERVLACRSDPCSLWNVITDTERMNRAIGSEPLALEPVSDAGAARYVVSTRLGGFSVAYEERPFEWVYLQSFRVRRDMRNGPMRRLEIGYELTPHEGGTKLSIRLAIDPRWGVLSPVLRFRAGSSMKQLAAEILRIDEALAAGRRPAPPPGEHLVDDGAIDRAAAQLEDAGPIAPKLVELVKAGADMDVSRIRPYEVADDWGVDRREMLSTCLRGVRAGLLELRWEIVCPSCRTATQVLPSLADLGQHGACQLCELEFSTDLDEAVEATFAPARGVRRVDAGPYCIGGPARTPHVVAQAIVPAKGEARLVAPEEPGSLRLFVRGGPASPVDVVAGAPADVRVRVADLASDRKITVAPRGTITVGGADEERHAKLEQVQWVKKAATAREVTSLPQFRRDFSHDVLRPGLALSVSRVGLLFTDLTGSTQLYATAGDALAFKLVQDHFDVVLKLVELHGGTLVKTIGDAVMAVFADDVDGVVASLAILDAFEPFRGRGDPYDRTHIKLGVFGGPCYVVTANGVLDYFGQTVNVAARLQGEAKSGELVVTAELADVAVAKGVLPAERIFQRYEASLKGVDRPIAAVRVR